MKIFGMILILVSSSGIAYILSKIHKTRIDQLCQWKEALTFLKNDIHFCLTPLSEAFENVGKRSSGSLSEFILKLSRLFHDSISLPIEQIDEQIIIEYFEDTCLKKEDQLKIIDFIKKFGLMDKDTQLSHIDMQICQLSEELASLTKDADKNDKMYKTLGLLCGVFVIILLI